MTDTMQRKRLFVAIDINSEIRDAISKYVGSLRDVRDEGIRWEKIEKIHLTVKFLGDADVSTISALDGELTRAAASTTPFRLEVSGSGVFPSLRKVRVLWIGVSPSDELQQLHLNIEELLEPVGFPRENRLFNPHLTIARVRDAQNAGPLIAHHIADAFPPHTLLVDEVILYESKLQPSGSVYKAVNRYALKGKTNG